MSEYQNVLVSKQELLKALRYDCVTFFSMYIGEDLSLEVPELHIEIWAELLEQVNQINQAGVTQSLRKLFAVPREHAKTTVAKLAVILLLKYTDMRFVLYASKTNGYAKNAVRDILMWLGGENEKELFGPITYLKSSETESLWIFDMIVRDLVTGLPSRKRCIFKALGARQQVRGLLIDNIRPQIVIVDDIEDMDNTTQELQPQLDEWFMGSFMKAFASRHFVLFIGNMIRKTTLLARLSKEKSWNPTVFGSIVRDAEGNLRALWEGKNTVEGLLTEYAEYRRMGTGHIWEAEMMNLTQDDVLGESLGNIIRPPVPDPEDLEAGFIVLDPAFGEKSHNDESAITVHARIAGYKVPAVIDSWAGKVSETTLFERMIDMSMRWGLSTWIIESVAAQRLFIPYFKTLLQINGWNPEAFLLLPITGGKNSKASRIVAFRNAVKNHSYGLSDSVETLAARLQAYSPATAKHDDLEDSAAYGPVAWTYYGDSVLLKGIARSPHQAWGRGSYQAPQILDEFEVANY